MVWETAWILKWWSSQMRLPIFLVLSSILEVEGHAQDFLGVDHLQYCRAFLGIVYTIQKPVYVTYIHSYVLVVRKNRFFLHIYRVILKLSHWPIAQYIHCSIRLPFFCQAADTQSNTNVGWGPTDQPGVVRPTRILRGLVSGDSAI